MFVGFQFNDIDNSENSNKEQFSLQMEMNHYSVEQAWSPKIAQRTF